MSTMPWTKWYTGDWLRDPQVSALSPAARGIWVDAINCMMEQGSASLEGEPAQLCRMLRCNQAELESAIREWSDTKVCDITIANGRHTFTNRRRLRELQISMLRSEAGSKGGTNRWQKHSKDDGKGDSKPLISVSSSTSSSEKEEVQEKPRNDYPEDFETFWRAYPKKVGKVAAYKEWKRATNKPELSVVIAALEKQKTWQAWTKDGGQFIPDPERWIKKGRWEDQPLDGQPTQPNLAFTGGKSHE